MCSSSALFSLHSFVPMRFLCCSYYLQAIDTHIWESARASLFNCCWCFVLYFWNFMVLISLRYEHIVKCSMYVRMYVDDFSVCPFSWEHSSSSTLEINIYTHTHAACSRRALTLNQIAVHFLGDFLFTLFGCLLICSNNIMYTCLGISAYSLIRAAAAVADDDDDGGKHRL